MTYKKILLIAGVAVCVGAIGFAVFMHFAQKEDQTTTAVTRGTLTKTITADGQYVAKEKADVSFRIPGSLTVLAVDVGDNVEKGDVIARIDTGTLNEKLHQAQEGRAAQQEILDYQRRKKDRFNKEQVASQKAAVRQADATIDEVKKQFRYTAVTAPISGTVAQKHYEIGEMIGPHQPVVTIIAEDEMEIQARVAEVNISDVRVGQNVDVTFDAYPDDRVFHATITHIDPAAVVIGNVPYYVVKLQVKNPDDGFRHGMRCEIRDEVLRKDGVLLLPRWIIAEEGDKKFVTVRTHATARDTRRKEITTGAYGDYGMVEILSGVDENDVVVHP